ncbi:phage tail protein [Niallia sp. RD1]|uniref:phage tail protein n=1 Tax=Niallia sp. RD1 TaxID=2962858 RepID=UPI0020C196A0|nr:phage tail protein [Niallia sp. RD1]UTI41129.1 phage tail protein [Niallia sp. RD1]
MIKTKNLQLQQTAVLQNAYNISYEKVHNQLWSASFSLPLNDPKNKYCTPLSFVEIVDDYINSEGEEVNEYVGLFRIVPKTTVKNASTNEVTYELEHVLATLLDKQIFGFEQTTNLTTRQNIELLLDMQIVKHWKLGDVETTRYFSYNFENTNLLSAIFSIPNPFDVEMKWTWDTQSYPWTLNLVNLETTPTCEIREGYNLIDLSVEENPMGIYNRIYPLGYGEGVNQLTIKKVNNNIPYVEDTESIALYGVREYVWVDKRYTNDTALKAAAESLLVKWKEPIIKWKTTAAELSKITGLSKDKFREGAVVRLHLDDFPVTDVRIVKESRSDIKKEEWNVSLELGNLTDDIATTSTDLERRQQINELNTDGYTNLLTYSYNDNADNENPAEIQIFIPEETVRLNKAVLSYKTDNFRAYERAIEGGGAIVSSTSSGGATVQSTSSGGASTQTSSSGGGVSTSTSSGGGTTQTSAAGGDHYHLMFKGGSSVTHDESNDREFFANASSSGGATARVVFGGTIATSLYTRGSSGNHSHSVSVPAHTHDFNVPAHTHSVSTPAHTHDVSVPAHTHDITLPNHTHAINFGIYKLSTLPTSVTIKIDGNTHTIHSVNADDVDLIPYLSKESDGRVTRGWHTIEILPNARGRINAQIYTQFFISGHGGGDY